MPRRRKHPHFAERRLDAPLLALFEAIVDPAFLLAPDGTILDANTAFTSLVSGHSREINGMNAYGQEISGIDIPEIARGLKENADEAVRSGKRITFEETRNEKTLTHTIAPAFSPDGRLTHLFVIVRPGDTHHEPDRKANSIHKALLEVIPGSVFIMNDRGRLIDWNSRTRDIILGKSRDDMLDIDLFSIIHHDDRKKTRDKLFKVLDLGTEETVEARIMLYGLPEYQWRMIHGRRIMIDDQPYLLGVGIDINERKRTEEELIANRRRLAQALESARAGIWEWDLISGENIWSDEIWPLYGLRKGDMEPSFDLWASTIHPDDREMAVNAISETAEKRAEVNIEYRVLHPDGQESWLYSRGKPFRDESGRTVRYIGTIIDVTERKQMMESLRQSESRYRSLFDNMPKGITYCRLIYDGETPKDFIHLDVNPAFEEITGLRNVIGKGMTEIFPNIRTTDEEFFLRHCRVAITGITEHFEYYLKPIDQWVSVSLYSIEKDHFVAIIEIITEQKKASKLISEGKAKLEAALASMSDAVFFSDADGNFIDFNEAFATFHKFSSKQECASRLAEYPLILDILDVDGKPRPLEQWSVSRALRGETCTDAEYTLRRKDTGETWIGSFSFAPIRNDQGVIIGAVVTARDVTERNKAAEEREKLQAQLQQAQKMELVGQLAGGIAHDFNNVLAAILGYTELLINQITGSHPFHENLEAIRKSAIRSAQMIHQLLAFARKQLIVPESIELDKSIKSLYPMIRRLIGENIRLTWHPSQKHTTIRIDPSQLDQIVTNLMVNARDAIEGHGIISIRTDTTNVRQADCDNGHACHAPGDYARLSVTDTGSGIDPQILPHIFEPYFTTKEVGKGSGLGLSTVYGIVKQNHGFIDCHSVPGEGSTFNIYLPLRSEARNIEGASEPEAAPARDAKKRVLLVEDEPEILKLIKRILEKSGYHVLESSGIETAIEISGHNLGHIDLLIADVMLPKMNGIELSEKLRRDNPELKVLFMSGYAQETIGVEGMTKPGSSFIQKPFTFNNFINAVNLLLNPQHILRESCQSVRNQDPA